MAYGDGVPPRSRRNEARKSYTVTLPSIRECRAASQMARTLSGTMRLEIDGRSASPGFRRLAVVLSTSPSIYESFRARPTQPWPVLLSESLSKTHHTTVFSKPQISFEAQHRTVHVFERLGRAADGESLGNRPLGRFAVAKRLFTVLQQVDDGIGERFDG